MTKEYLPHERPAQVKSGVYCIKHKESGKVYVGSAVDLKRRRKDHTTRLNCGTHNNEYLQRAWSKHGRDAFEFSILEHCAPEARLVREQHWMNELRSTDEAFGYNILPTRLDQSWGASHGKRQRKRWEGKSKEERSKLCAHLMEPTTRAMSQAKATAAKNTPEYRELRSKIAMRGLATPKQRAYNSARLKRLWQDPGFRQKRLDGLTRGRNKTNAARREKKLGDEIVWTTANKEAVEVRDKEPAR